MPDTINEQVNEDRMKAFSVKALAACVALLLIAIHAQAQPVFWNAVSIEAMVGNADLVAIAKIVKLGDGPFEGADDNKSPNATIAIERILKSRAGETHEKMGVHMRHPRSVLAGWRDNAHRLLVAVRDDSAGADGVIDLDDDNLAVFTEDLAVLRDPADIIRLADETVQRIPRAIRRLHTFSLWAPSVADGKAEWATYSGVFVTVLADDRLQKRAHDYLQSDDQYRRSEGVRALAYFRSDENIALLKGLLNDPNWDIVAQAESNDGIEVRHFGVRDSAFRILKSWNIHVEKPVVSEEIEKLERVTAKYFSYRSPIDKAEVKALSRFKNLESLYFEHSVVTDGHLKAVGCLTNLQALYLNGTGVTDAGLKELKGLTRLRHLELAGTKVTDAGLKELVEFKSLRQLSLRDAQTTDEGIGELSRFRPELEIER